MIDGAASFSDATSCSSAASCIGAASLRGAASNDSVQTENPTPPARRRRRRDAGWQNSSSLTCEGPHMLKLNTLSYSVCFWLLKLSFEIILHD